MGDLGRRIDLHTHSLLSDGELLPTELLRRANALGYEAVALTDHVDASNIESVVEKTLKAVRELERHAPDTQMIPGVELTYLPPATIPRLAAKARKLGVKLVAAHGETIVEPVLPNTNRVAVECGEVDLLVHPGLVTLEEAEIAAKNGVYFELTSRRGHSLTNGHVAKMALKAGVGLVVNTDLHTPSDYLTQEEAFRVALGAGLEEQEARRAIRANPRRLLSRVIEK